MPSVVEQRGEEKLCDVKRECRSVPGGEGTAQGSRFTSPVAFSLNGLLMVLDASAAHIVLLSVSGNVEQRLSMLAEA